MDTQQIKEEVDKNIERLAMLRDEVKLQLHLASLDARTEWDEKLAPRVVEVEKAAKTLSESSRIAVKELITKLEEFLAVLRDSVSHSTT